MAKRTDLDPSIEYGMLGETAMAEIRALASGLSDNPTFEEVELGALQIARRLERILMQASLEMAAKRVQGKKKCPKCLSVRTYFRETRQRQILSILGAVKFSSPKYRCQDCGKHFYAGWQPVDLADTKFSKAFIRQVVTLAVHMPIAQALRVLKEFSTNKICDFSVRKLLAKIGTHYANHCEADLTLQELQAAEKNKSAAAEIGYILPDGAFVPTKGEKKREYAEYKLSVMFTSDDITETRQANGKTRIDIRLKRFAMQLGQGVEEFSKNISKVAILKGVTAAKKLVFISDGAAYLRNICKKLYPQAIRILDWLLARRRRVMR